jgi:hypothetical protein
MNKDREKGNGEQLAPIYQRLEQIINEKKDYLKRLQSEKYQEENKEAPAISQKSKEIVERKGDFKKNVLERLFSYMREKNDRLEQRAEEKQERIEQECPFQPSINYHSHGPDEGHFLERQEREAEKARERMAYLQEAAQAPFHPNINRLSSLLIEAERAEETEMQRIDRLHYEPYLERKAEIERIEEEIYKECTFQPEINPISKGLQGVPHSHRCACHPKEEHYHFHPQINPKSRELAGKNKPKEAGQAVEQARLELEYR